MASRTPRSPPSYSSAPRPSNFTCARCSPSSGSALACSCRPRLPTPTTGSSPRDIETRGPELGTHRREGDLLRPPSSTTGRSEFPHRRSARMADSSSGPTVVLVHGAFADAGSWALVTERLIAAGVPVTPIVNPLRGVASDAAYVASFINQIDGTVLAVGHSYGGAIITNAVSRTTNVVGLVYVAAFAPDEGETVAGIIGRCHDSGLA